ncbi:MAG: hypothetical protein IT209_08315 [Armatimonadetes bacterium]|nr:hypothetical protein [Armatimonadota bacterium]
MLCLGTALARAHADYEKAVYPQTAPVVSSITVQAPGSAKLGETVKAQISVSTASAFSDDRDLYIYLVHAGAVRAAQVLNPAPATKSWKASGAKLKDVLIRIPKNIPTGDYSLVVGVYREKQEGRAPITVTGTQATRLAKIITRGRMVDKYGVGHEWFLNDAHALIWDGKPWMPAGGMFVYDRDWNVVKAQIDLLHKYGVRSIYLHLGVNQPYPWKTYSDDDYRFFQQTIDYLDDLGFTYGVEFQALEAKGPGFYYPAPGPRKDITSSGRVEVQQDKTLSGYFAVFDRHTQQIVQTGEVSVTDGKSISADVKVPKPGDYTVTFGLKRQAPDMFSMYYWDQQYPNYVEVVRKHYSKVALGPGFRFLVDPLWNEMNVNRDFYPASDVYYQQFADWLLKRYGTVDKLNEAWHAVTAYAGEQNASIAGVDSFDTASRLIPIDRKDAPGNKILQYMMDPQTGRVFAMDLRKGQFNYDTQEFLGRSLLYYTCDIADQFKKLYDVPVIYKGFSDMDFWHINDLGTPGGHDGLGMESYGNGEPMMLFMAAHLYGELEQATKTTWLVVTETGQGAHQDNSPSRNKPPGYTSRLDHMYANYNAMLSGGAKGIFQYNMVPGRGSNDPWTDALISDPRQLEWLATYDRILANAPALAEYKPPMYFRYPGLFNPNSMNLRSEPADDYANMGGWWWREPVERAANDIWIVPSFSLRPEAPMLIVNLEDSPATERFRDEVSNAIKENLRLTVIGFRRNPGAAPELDKYYEDAWSTDTDGRKFQPLRPTATSRVIGRNEAGQVWNLMDGNLQIISKEVFAEHGYRPEFLETGGERGVEPYYGVFRDLLGVRLLNVGEGLYGLTYSDGGTPVTVLGLTNDARESRTLSFLAKPGSVEAQFPSGEKTGVERNGSFSVKLDLVGRKLIKVDEWPLRDQNRWVQSGVIVDSTNAHDSVVLRGLPEKDSVPAEAARSAILEAARTTPAAGDAQKRALQRTIERSQSELQKGNSAGAMDLLAQGVESVSAQSVPYIWQEAEDRQDSNFNYSRLGAIPTLSGAAFLGLETAVKPPSDTGWYATYRIDVPKEGDYQLWVRENYLGYSSPCYWRIGPPKGAGGEWQRVTQQLIAKDAEVVALYNAVEDTRQVFAWYHYGQAHLTKGRHDITFKVTEPRGKGLAVTMSDDRQYAKLMDCLVLVQGDFQPNGKDRPRLVLPNAAPPRQNMIPNASFEFRPDQAQKIPTGWTRSEDSDDLVWQDAGWGTYNVMPGVAMDLGQRFAYIGQRNLTIKPGKAERFWQTTLPAALPGQKAHASVYVRSVGAQAAPSLRVLFLDAAGKEVGRKIQAGPSGDFDWRELTVTATAPEQTRQIRLELVSPSGSSGVVFFDDVALWQLQGE